MTEKKEKETITINLAIVLYFSYYISFQEVFDYYNCIIWLLLLDQIAATLTQIMQATFYFPTLDTGVWNRSTLGVGVSRPNVFFLKTPKNKSSFFVFFFPSSLKLLIFLHLWICPACPKSLNWNISIEAHLQCKIPCTLFLELGSTHWQNYDSADHKN